MFYINSSLIANSHAYSFSLKRLIMHLSLLFFVQTALCMFTAFNVHAEKLYFDITNPYMRKIPVAILPMDTGNSLENNIAAQKLVKVIKNDLEFQGFFSVSDQTDYDRLMDSDWVKSGIEYVLKGKVNRTDNNLLMELRLIDSSNGKMRTGRRYKASDRDIRTVAHRFCDLVVKEVTGHLGVSLSKIFYIKQTGKEKSVFSSDFDGYNIKHEVLDRSINLSPSCSPDGLFLAYTSFASGRPCLYLKNLNTGKQLKLTSFSGLNISPAWHPDSKTLAATFSLKDSPQIFQIDLQGNIVRQLTKGPGINVSPSWSPDGHKIAFVSDRKGTPQLFISDIATGREVRLTYSGTYNTEPCWSPDGKQIAYTGRIQGKFQIFIIPVSGGEAKQITFDGSNEHPSWSPDSRLIICSTTLNGGEKKLMTLFSDGSGKRILPIEGTVSMPSWGPRVMN